MVSKEKKLNSFIINNFVWILETLARQEKKKYWKKETTPAGLEPARENPKRFLIFRLNRSAIVPNSYLLICPHINRQNGQPINMMLLFPKIQYFWYLYGGWDSKEFILL